MSEKCIVHGCPNERHQGQFIGDMCKPCYIMITTGKPNQNALDFITKLYNAKLKLESSIVDCGEKKKEKKKKLKNIIDKLQIRLELLEEKVRCQPKEKTEHSKTFFYKLSNGACLDRCLFIKDNYVGSIACKTCKWFGGINKSIEMSMTCNYPGGIDAE